MTIKTATLIGIIGTATGIALAAVNEPIYSRLSELEPSLGPGIHLYTYLFSMLQILIQDGSLLLFFVVLYKHQKKQKNA